MSFKSKHPILHSLIGPALLVSALGAVLAAIALPRIPETRARSRATAVRGAIRVLVQKLENERATSGAYPKPLPFTSLLESPPPFISEFGALSTPEAIDTFLPRKRIPLVYQTDGPRWVLISMGPDEVYSLPPRQFLANKLSATTLANATYDPTNGMFSPGDIYRASVVPKP